MSIRIGILSDIHVDQNGESPDHVVNALATTLQHNAPDAFVLAGDVSNDYTLSLSVLSELEIGTGIPVYFVPGNHDLWNRTHPDMDAWQIHDAFGQFPGTLSGRVLDLAAGWQIVGEAGWYDFSYGDSAYSEEDFERMEIDGRVWQDRVFADWKMGTRQVHQVFLARLRERLSSVRDPRRTLMVTHAVPVSDFTVPFMPELWNYLNAFLGSEAYGELAREFGVPASICGHVHFRREVKHPGRGGSATRFICNCLGYTREWRGDPNPFLEVPKAYREITLPDS
jgi:putative phosphoesterase